LAVHKAQRADRHRRAEERVHSGVLPDAHEIPLDHDFKDL